MTLAPNAPAGPPAPAPRPLTFPAAPQLDPATFTDPALIPIAEKLLSSADAAAPSARLDFSDGMALFATRDIFALAALADHVRRAKHADRAYYNINRHLNYTNICALSCKFCEFHRKRGESGAYEYGLEDIFRIAADAYAHGATEVHIVGGLHPWLPFDWYLDMLRGLRARFPKLHVKAFTAIEINHFAKIAKLSVREVLLALKEAGLGSMPGGGAEVFDNRVHDQIFQGKLRSDGWITVHRTAHQLGIRTNATILYGHVESRAERIRHLLKLRALQDESLAQSPTPAPAPEPAPSPDSRRAGETMANGKWQMENPPAAFQTIIPLSFIPDGSQLAHLPGPTGLEDLKMLAISRLLLPNFPHVKAFWIMQSMKLSQVSLNWGVDDLDGTVVWYDITKREGGSGNTHQEMTAQDIRRLIIEAGFTPIERDTLYRPITRGPNGPTDWRVA